jgi:hypothetical protein
MEYEIFYQSGTWYEVCCNGITIANGLRSEDEAITFIENFDKLSD